MALHVTQCPRCESTFNTSARMLQAAHGLVRCGACLSIFEADQHFVQPLPDASNDEHSNPGGDSVFISAPEEYFDSAEFLNHDEEADDNVFDSPDEAEPLYASSDVHDSSFDVFDVDPELIKPKAHEQIHNSDFDVFDAGEFDGQDESRKAEIQDSDFDVFDAGERTFDRPAGTPQKPKGSAAEASEDTLPPHLVDDAGGIRPAGPATAPHLKPRHGEDTVVILPAGPDAATLLAERKKANRQADDAEDFQQPESAPDARPEQADYQIDDTVDDTFDDPVHGSDDDSIDEFSELLVDGLDDEEAQLEAAMDSVVILPADPYQPSAFTASGEQSPQAGDENKRGATPMAQEPIPDPVPAVKQDRPGNHEAVSNPDSYPEQTKPDAEAEDDTKDMIRSRVMTTEINQPDESLEQLSEENLRAVRDVNTALELPQQKHTEPRKTGYTGYIAGGMLLAVVLSSLVFFWVKMPQLSQSPGFRPWYQSACNLIGCQLPDYVDPGLVETSNLVVRSHPERDNALELTAVFRNIAQFQQPFPLIELTFSDLDNSPIMVFEFLPDEYLPQALRGMPLMPVGAPVQITLDLADPGGDAVNYQMTFKAAPPRPR